MNKLKNLFKHDSSDSPTESAAPSHTQGGSAPASTTSAQAPQSGTATHVSSDKPSGVLMTTNYGDITIALYSDKTPRTCQNFAGLADAGKYDGVIFHRVIPQFMLQGGDPTGTGRGGESIWGGKFEDEFDNSLLHTGPGVMSMANSGPGTNGSQFFITLAPTPHLNGKHTVFGQVVDGLDVVEKIGSALMNELHDHVDTKLSNCDWLSPKIDTRHREYDNRFKKSKRLFAEHKVTIIAPHIAAAAAKLPSAELKLKVAEYEIQRKTDGCKRLEAKHLNACKSEIRAKKEYKLLVKIVEPHTSQLESKTEPEEKDVMAENEKPKEELTMLRAQLESRTVECEAKDTVIAELTKDCKVLVASNKQEILDL
ncbi:hypothetical protein SLS59_002225 [Nothophoma quercina]|uniref:Peptidyl-prolyl cis-trans isomerase-like 1 n=1 Tax=Nothophoma quercina TaxID=749835 RepID=A0ABR3RS44_9PLEO